MGRKRSLDRAALMAKVCERIASGELVKAAAEAEGTDPRRIREWAHEDEQFAALYARARESQCHALAETVLTIADDTTIPHESRRVMVDARKWFVAKVAPKHYGEKLDVTSGDKPVSGVVLLPQVAH